MRPSRGGPGGPGAVRGGLAAFSASAECEPPASGFAEVVRATNAAQRRNLSREESLDGVSVTVPIQGGRPRLSDGGFAYAIAPTWRRPTARGESPADKRTTGDHLGTVIFRRALTRSRASTRALATTARPLKARVPGAFPKHGRIRHYPKGKPFGQCSRRLSREDPWKGANALSPRSVSASSSASPGLVRFSPRPPAVP